MAANNPFQAQMFPQKCGAERQALPPRQATTATPVTG